MFEANNPLDGWRPPSREEIAQLVREASEETLGALAEHVRSEAEETPGWEELGKRIGVHAADGETYMGLPPDDPEQQKMFDLEFGTPKQAPTGFLRSSFDRFRDDPGVGGRAIDKLLGPD